MKSKNIFVIAVLFCLMLLSACSSNLEQSGKSTEIEIQPTTEETAIVSKEEDTNAALIASLREKAYVDFDRKYIDIVENLNYGSEIVGSEVTQKWVNEVCLKQSPKEQIELPGLYQMIKYFSIPKEEFIELNDSYRDRGVDWGVIPDEY